MLKRGCCITTPLHPLAMTLPTLLLAVLLPLLLLVAIADLATMSEPRRVRMLHRQGLSQRAIAHRLNLTRYRVRHALA